MVKRLYEMIENFEKETKDLTDYEKRILLPIMVKCLANHKGKDMAVSNSQMCLKMSECGYQISDTRVRKIINHIRINALVECLIASGQGYYVAQTKREMERYITSLRSREEAIGAMRMALEEQLQGMKEEPTENNPDGLRSSPLPLT